MINTNEFNGKSPAAVALGLFDGLHIGHIEVIKQVILQTELLPTVFTFSGNSVLPKMRRRENIILFQQKLSMLEQIGVQRIYAPDFEETKDLSPYEFVEQILVGELNAKFVSCGENFGFGKDGKGNPRLLKEICRDFGIKVKVVPMALVNNKPVNSTEIRRLIKNGEIAAANKLLGYELTYDLEVVHGKKLGRQLGSPTINQVFPEGNVLPRFGVYKSYVRFDTLEYVGITNIGIKPTVDEETAPLLETHIIGYDGDMDTGLYGKMVKVSLVEYIRDEKKFDSVYQLKSQIQSDISGINNRKG